MWKISRPKPKSVLIIISFLIFIFWTAGGTLSWVKEVAAADIFQAYAKPLPSPDFSLENLECKMVDIRDFRGKVVLVNFWATW